MKKITVIVVSVLIFLNAVVLPGGIIGKADASSNLLDTVSLSSLPARWTESSDQKMLSVNSYGESKVPFSGVSLDPAKSYEYKMTLRFSEAETNGSARIMFRYLEGDDNTCQVLCVKPGIGIFYGTDYDCSDNTAEPSEQPQINLNTDYEVKIITSPASVKVYLDGTEVLAKTDNISAGGTLVGLADYNVRFTMRNVYLAEFVEPNLLNDITLSSTPDGWSYDSLSKTITVDTYSEFQVPFRDVLLESSKIYEYKMTLNFASISTYGRARIFFRHASGDFNTCQTLAVIPGEGLAYGTDYWCSGNYAAPASQPQINLNTDYEIKIVTAPTWIKVYLNGVLMFTKDGITSGGTLIGLASYNAKFTAKNVSLREVTNLLEDVTLSTTPAGWSYNAVSKEINVTSFGDNPVPFSGISLDPAKTYEYKMTLNFSELSTYGMAKIMFRENSDYNDANYLKKCQVLWVMPSEGLSYGGDYWHSFNYAAPASQPQINLNTDYEVKIITSPTAVTVYFNGVEILSKSDNITAQGNWVGLGAYNAKFTAKNISLKESTGSETGGNLLDTIHLAYTPTRWSLDNNDITVSTYGETPVWFNDVSLDSTKTYEYKAILNFSTTDTNGSARLLFRANKDNMENECQAVYLQPGEGVQYGTGYWLANRAAPASQPVVAYNTDYELKIITAPNLVKIYLDNVELISVNNISAGGAYIGLADYNAKFTMKNISLIETVAPEGPKPGDNLLDKVNLAFTPSGWSCSEDGKTITADTFNEYQVPFGGVSLDPAKMYEYRMTVNLKEVATNGSVRLMFRHANNNLFSCQILWLMPGEGLSYGTDYWHSNNYAVPSEQPSIDLNKNYDVRVVTGPTWVDVYLDGVKYMRKTGVAAEGNLVGLAGYNAKFTATNIFLTELTDYDVPLPPDPNAPAFDVPGGWTFDSAQNTVYINKMNENIVKFKNYTLDKKKSYLYKMTVRITAADLYGSVRIPFRFKSLHQTEMLYLQLGGSMLFSADYWGTVDKAEFGYNIEKNVDYSVEIATHPGGVIISINGQEVKRITDEESVGSLIGLASYNVNAVVSGFSLTEIDTPEGFDWPYPDPVKYDPDLPSADAPDNEFKHMTLRVPAEGLNNPASWSYQNGVVKKVSTNEEYAFFDGLGLNPDDSYLFSGKIKITRDAPESVVWGGARIVLRGTTKADTVVLSLWKGDSDLRLFYGISVEHGQESTMIPFDYEVGREYSFRVYSYKDHIKVYFDGDLVFETKTPNYVAGLGVDAAQTDIEMSNLYLKRIPYAEMESTEPPQYIPQDYDGYDYGYFDLEAFGAAQNPNTERYPFTNGICLMVISGIAVLLLLNKSAYIFRGGKR